MKNEMTANAKRLPACWTTIEDDARTMTRLEFVARFCAHQTKTEAGRSIVGGMQVVMVDGGYLYGWTSVGPSCAGPMDAARLYDAIRRTRLGHYTRAAEEYREYVLAPQAA